MKTCYIVGAGSFETMLTLPTPEDYVIAADGGYHYLQRMGITPNLLMGDFDSMGDEKAIEQIEIIRHPSVKDDTDMALAVDHAMKLGYRRFLLYGGLGGRLDHTIANIQLMTKMVQENCVVYLIGDGSIITLLQGETVHNRLDFPALKEIKQSMISVFSLSEGCEGVTISGLKYEIENATLTYTRALGVSNEFIGREASISLKRGSLLVMWSDEVVI